MQVIGAALNSVTSLFNNSCDVNTVKFHQGRKTVMLARFQTHIESNLSDNLHTRRDITAGEEVSDFYGQHYFQAKPCYKKQYIAWNIKGNQDNLPGTTSRATSSATLPMLMHCLQVSLEQTCFIPVFSENLYDGNSTQGRLAPALLPSCFSTFNPEKKVLSSEIEDRIIQACVHSNQAVSAGLLLTDRTP